MQQAGAPGEQPRHYDGNDFDFGRSSGGFGIVPERENLKTDSSHIKKIFVQCKLQAESWGGPLPISPDPTDGFCQNTKHGW